MAIRHSTDFILFLLVVLAASHGSIAAAAARPAWLGKLQVSQVWEVNPGRLLQP